MLSHIRNFQKETMKFCFSLRYLLWVWITAVLLSGCMVKSVSTAFPTNSPVPFLTITPTVPAASTVTPTSIPETQTPQPGSIPSPIGMGGPPSGWTIFTNPDYVQGVAIYDHTIWAATLGGVVAWDQQTGASTLYTTRDGLAEIQGNDVVSCPMPEAQIIIAHSSGLLSTYDIALQKWSRILITFDDGSSLKDVSTLFCDANNHRLIVGSKEGLGILDIQTGRWKRIGPAEGLKVNSIRSIDVVGQAIWIAAEDKSAFLIMGSTIFPFDKSSGLPSGKVNDLAVVPDKQIIWFGYSTGLVRFQDKKWNSFGAQAASGIPFQSVDHVEVSPDKHIWIASADEGVCPFDPVTLFCSTIYPGIRGAPITDLVIGPDGVAYAATNGSGVLVLAADKVTYLAFERQNLISNDVLDISSSQDGKVWVSTDRGVNVLDPARDTDSWQVITPKQNQLPFPRVTGLLPAANGMWMFFNREPQASFFDGKDWLHLDIFKGIPGPVISAALDQRGYVWFATTDGIKVWDGTLFRSYDLPDGVSANMMHVIMEEDGVIWVGTDRGLLRYEKFQWKSVLPEIPIYTIASDPAGELLLGTSQGLIRYKDGQSFLWIINLGDQVITNPRVSSIAWDGSGRLWVGTTENGLFSYDGDHWEQFDTFTGLPANNVRKIFTDRFGAVWIAAVTGEGGGALVRFMP